MLLHFNLPFLFPNGKAGNKSLKSNIEASDKKTTEFRKFMRYKNDGVQKGVSV